jgi:pyruvate formate lyase activating enzyme
MDNINSNFFKKARYQKKINEKISQCLTCERRCKISKDKTGVCKTRINKDGEIYSIVYGCIPALSFNPIEKKPLYHFYPGTKAITIGTYGCNFNCFWCQNHHLSHPSRPVLEKVLEEKEFLSPEKLIQIALKKDCQGTSISFNEPTLLFEYSLEVFKLAKEKYLYNTYITNGYMTEVVLKDLVDYGLNAMNIDIKGDAEMVKKYCGTDVEKVWRNAKIAKDLGVHVEITTLMIDTLNTDKAIIKNLAKRILEDLGKDTPYHITRFFPHYKSQEHGLTGATPVKYLEQGYNIAKEVGLDFVYLGNLMNTEYDHTKCPKCSNYVIKRVIFGTSEIILDTKGNCKFCGYPISISHQLK